MNEMSLSSDSLKLLLQMHQQNRSSSVTSTVSALSALAIMTIGILAVMHVGPFSAIGKAWGITMIVAPIGGPLLLALAFIGCTCCCCPHMMKDPKASTRDT